MRVIAFYSFFNVSNPRLLKERLNLHFLLKQIKGSIIVSEEGLNGTIAVSSKLEKKIISQNNTELSLMFKAGTAIFNHINELNKKDIIILIGPGNNGGDGYALAIQAFLNNYNINCIELIESK